MGVGEDEVLVAAKHLVGMDGVEQVAAGAVSYIHILFERHEIVCADGAWSESFQPSRRMLALESMRTTMRWPASSRARCWPAR